MVQQLRFGIRAWFRLAMGDCRGGGNQRGGDSTGSQSVKKCPLVKEAPREMLQRFLQHSTKYSIMTPQITVMFYSLIHKSLAFIFAGLVTR